MEDNSTPAVSESQAPVETPETQANEQERPQTEALPTKNLKKLKLKVDGQEVEEEIDLNDEETLKRHLQMSRAAQKRMSEAAQVRRQAEQFISRLKSDPIAILNDPSLGVDFKKIAEEYLAEQIQNEMMSPEQRKIKEYESKLRSHEEEQKRQREEHETRQMEELKSRYVQDYDKKIGDALATSGLPKTPKTVRRMAELMHKNLEFGFELEPNQLVEIVRQDYLAEMKEMFSAADGDTLLKLLGDDTANKIRKADLARIKSAKPSFEKKPANTHSEPEKPSRKMTTDEWFEQVRKRAMG